ncbi:methyl-accepting chemotaxis protein [Flintibacter sp. NSJ-23]|uniref:Methyl-accepting chemotaxis protein n=1 Tax=Flintibacter hominis TaxID=2763048 RepID=A0A8J6M5I3_9FIRM|nr:methyl-accepting chemotaxis protein [Flintibacter hominis]MBC5721509.1 methyl-accepting chemotaxis protein [Flintibacter hominis]
MKRKRTDWIRRAVSVLLTLILCAQAAGPILAVEDGVIRITCAEDLLELSRNCALDTWSQGKHVALTADISLAGTGYTPIPTFGGTFDGGGYTISGLDLSSGLTPAGVFGTLQEGAVVKDLHVTGSIEPSGHGSSIGGIAGENYGVIAACSFSGTITGTDRVGGIAGLNGLTGKIQGCSAAGGITGKSMTGGIAGENCGVLSGCRNNSYVNITSTDPGLELTNLDLDVSKSLFTLSALDTVNIATDTGGIAGYSSGMVLSCINAGVVGYPHIGYNVGGIAGRSCGHVAYCVNRGQVFGRKDIGGIVGQAEPYIVLNLSEDMLDTIQKELDRLGGLVDRAADHADGAAGRISDNLDAIGASVDDATGHAKDLTDRLSDYGDEVITEINRGSDILADALDQMADISSDATGFAEELTDSLDLMEDALRELARIDGSQAVDELERAADSIEKAGRLLKSGIGKIIDGLEQLRNFVRIEDETGSREALEKIEEGVGETAQAAEELGRAMDLAAQSGVVEDVAAQSMEELRGEMGQISDALTQVGGGAETVRLNISFDLEDIREGLRQIRSGVKNVVDSSGAAMKAVDSLGDALDELKAVGQELSDGLDALADAVSSFEQAGETGTEVFAGLEDLFGYLAGVDPIQIAHPGEEVSAASDALYDTMERLNDQMGLLNDTAAASVGDLTGDIRAISAQVGVVTDTLIDAIREIENYDLEDSISDTSEENIDQVTSGRLLSCSNTAAISGDLNVGGVAGSMAVEYELDPEDDLISNSAPIYRRAYELKAILQRCTNTGAVVGRRDHVGSVCGRMDLGLILECEAYGSAESENGDYVGGVAGYAVGTIRESFAKCALSGKRYVGGIVGAAGTRDSGGSVTGCCSFVLIPEYEEYAGAISGTDQGLFQNNRFVSDDLAGLNRVSAAGRAEPISYEQLLQMEDIPTPMKRLELRFWADGRVIQTVPFDYGASFDDSILPEIPHQEGCFAVWDREDLTDLRFDTDVTAVYTAYRSALSSAQLRDDGRPVLFVEGEFDQGDSLEARLLETREDYPRQLQTLADRRRVLERWKVTIPADGQSIHTVRYLSPNGKTERTEFYAVSEDRWTRLDTETAGSYLLVRLEGDTPEIAVVTRTPIWWVWPIAAALVAGLVFCAVGWAKHRRLLQRAVAQDRETPAGSAGGGKKTRRTRLAAAVLVLACLIGGATWFLVSGGWNTVAAVRLLHRYAQQPDLTIEMDAQAEAGGRRYRIDALIDIVQVGEHLTTRLERDGAAVYYSDGMLYLGDGTSVRVDMGFPDYAALLDTVAGLYRDGDISAFSNSGENIYSVTVSGERVSSILKALFPDSASYLASLESLNLDLVAKGNELSALRLWTKGTADTTDHDCISLAVELRIHTAEGKVDLPQPVRARILAGDQKETAPDLLRLLLAWRRLNAEDPLVSRLSYQADCGPLVVDSELELFRTYVDGREVVGLRKSGQTLYMVDGGVLDEQGGSVSGQEELVSLPGVLLHLWLEGGLEYEERNGTGLYTLSLRQEEIEEVIQALLPEAEGLDTSLTAGKLQIELTDQGIERISFQVRGSVHVLSINAPVSISGSFTFPEETEEISIPAPVEEAVKREEG